MKPRANATDLLSRRSVLTGGVAWALLGSSKAKCDGYAIRIADDGPGRPISPLIYGSNEIGAMDHGALSADLDRIAGVTARRLGGNLMTAYNWVLNATNAGKDWNHVNGPFLLETLKIPKASWNRPAVIIETMHEASLVMGATSLVTLPLAGYVAADFAGTVSTGEAAPSHRFVPVRWARGTRASDPIDTRVADIPQLVGRLIERFGGAASPSGIRAYALDNEPGLWFDTHPRLVRSRTPIRVLIERSIAAARVLKAIDPAAHVFGPASWGATEMIDFQKAPDWNDFRHFGSFLAAYLDAFRQESERTGIRLLDALDIHWYPYSRHGELFRTERTNMAEALLDSPRSLTENGFREKSWVPDVLPVDSNEGLGLPLLPSLDQLVVNWFPGTKIAITEFNYGGPGQIASGLALADVIGRFGAAGIYFACHWGSLDGWLGEAYRLYRLVDGAGGTFGDRSFPVEVRGGPAVCAYAATSEASAPHLQLVVINKVNNPVSAEVAFSSGRSRRLVATLGFDAATSTTARLEVNLNFSANSFQFTLPARAARRYVFV